MHNIIVESSTGLIKYYDQDYLLFNNAIIVSKDGSVLFTVADLNASTVNIFQLDNPITDFMGNKYIYQDGEVVENPDWVDPTL